MTDKEIEAYIQGFNAHIENTDNIPSNSINPYNIKNTNIKLYNSWYNGYMDSSRLNRLSKWIQARSDGKIKIIIDNGK